VCFAQPGELLGSIIQIAMRGPEKLERMFSNFLWNYKMHVWNLKDICRPKRAGGMRIIRLSDIN